MQQQRACPLTKELVEYRRDSANLEDPVRWYECPVCGTLEVSEYAEDWLNSYAKPDDYARLIKQASELNESEYLSLSKSSRVQTIDPKIWALRIEVKQKSQASF
ncbi:hypothetical protein MTYM_02318 [Methylococcales bacterium]|nr:hypothetical protein MTYM_02318 [Methylococcales bacterium]